MKPDVDTRTSYELPDKNMILSFTLSSEGENAIVRFKGQIIREVSGGIGPEQAESIGEILEHWDQDCSDFKELAYQFYTSYVSKES